MKESFAETIKMYDREPERDRLPRDGRLRVLFVAKDNFGCGYYRMYMPAWHLKQKSERIIPIVTIIPHKSLLEWADVIVWQRQYRSDYLEMMMEAQRAGKVCVYDLDDNVHWVSKDNPAYVTFKINGPISHNVGVWMKQCDERIVSTRHMKVFYDILIEKECTVLENAVDCARFEGLGQRREFERTRIVWAGGYNHYDDLEVAVKPLRLLREKYGKRIKILLMGYDGTLRKTELPEGAESMEQAETVGWKTLDIPRDDYRDGMNVDEYYGALWKMNGDISLGPLAVNEFNRCKSNLKWLESSMAGMAFVGTNIAPYGKSIRNGVDGFVVDNDPECWVNAVSWLIENPVQRWLMVENAQAAIRARYSWEGRWKEYEEFLCGVCNCKLKIGVEGEKRPAFAGAR